ncbi:hypothetical protein [Persicobacter psychrovividus]|uniref:Uncharacterized protein n=1 Tax=Persicobacter psychrovividus TaxID=387638 RepID=A0ABM7VHM7_9BACT|nr:hypothetical protein PEPS_27520 [Persicobacter psychrovividus]
MKKLLIVGMMCLVGQLHAQALLSPMQDNALMFLKSAKVTTMDHQEVDGLNFKSCSSSNGRLKSFTLKKEDGSKQKFKAEQVEKVVVEPKGQAKLIMSSENASLVSTLKKDYSGIANTKYITFERVEYKKGKFALLQLLDPQIDEHVKVYLDPNAKKTTNFGGIVGGDYKEFFAKKGDMTIYLKKSKYKKQWRELFGDNAKFCQMMEDGTLSPKIKDLAYHIAVYNETI